MCLTWTANYAAIQLRLEAHFKYYYLRIWRHRWHFHMSWRKKVKTIWYVHSDNCALPIQCGAQQPEHIRVVNSGSWH
eukprot:COSAG01_NODE_65491_length_273_cov_0.591954_1_plen_76_part_10